MESKALLTSTAVSSAVYSVQQAEMSAQSDIAAEISTLKANIVTIEQATTTFISTYASGNKSETNLAIRDEKYAIGQQNFLIKGLQQFEKAIDSTLGDLVYGLNKGKLDPTTVPNILSTASSSFETVISTVDSTASYEKAVMVAVFAAGNT